MAMEERSGLAAQPDYVSHDKKIRRTVNWVFMAGAGFYICFHVGLTVWLITSSFRHHNAQFVSFVYQYWIVLIALPFVAFAALGLVLLLDSRYDQQMKIKGFGFEFEGASGPIVLWAICFLSMRWETGWWPCGYVAFQRLDSLTVRPASLALGRTSNPRYAWRPDRYLEAERSLT